MVSGARAPGGTFISERIERISVTSSISQPISSSASASSQASGITGQAASIRKLSRLGPPKAANSAHSSSVM